MEALRAVAGPQWLAAPVLLYLTIAIASLVVVTFVREGKPGRPPMLFDPLPHVANTYQYMTNMKDFFPRAAKVLQNSNIVGFYLGPNKVYFITGGQNVQTMFRKSDHISSDKFMIMIMRNLWAAKEPELAKFANDKTGRLKAPAPGTEGDGTTRYWAGFHRVVHDYIAKVEQSNRLAANYQRHFATRIEKHSCQEWSTISLVQFLRRDMAEAAIVSLLGPQILALTPNFMDLFWDFDEIAVTLAWGLPRWLRRDAWNKRDRFLAACAKYVEAAWANFDWDGPDADSDWEENFGARFTREFARWMKESGFSFQTSAAAIGVMGVFGQNSNTVPVATWGIMELAKDPALFQAVRAEVATAYVTDPVTGERLIDPQKMLSLPLLQSVYIELLRMHVAMHITREITQPTVLCGYELEKGALVQAPSELAHFDEEIWGASGHPASEFWAERHIQYEEVTDETGKVTRVPRFALVGRANDFFPYGGGISMCPGRYFAKQEIMLTLAMFASRFDIEFVGWTQLDGSPSDRPAKDHDKFLGAAAMPPDRDMQIRWKRLW
ncbi:cytochrome P450 [Thozetella sp. PMI_491]|nr:cytochrome P450 [Thozetella sp. PMI_491]